MIKKAAALFWVAIGLTACGARHIELSKGYQFGYYYISQVNVTEQEKGSIRDFERISPLIKQRILDFLKPSTKTPPDVTLTVQLTSVDIDSPAPSITANLILVDNKTHETIGTTKVYYQVEVKRAMAVNPFNTVAVAAAAMTNVILDSTEDNVAETYSINEFSYDVIKALYPLDDAT